MTPSRRWLLGGVAAAAALAGAGVSVQRRAAQDARRAEDAAAQAAEAAFWAMRFDAPGGGELVLADWRGKPLLVNFWATWCTPCLQEMPLLDAFFQRRRAAGFGVVGLAVDSPTPVRQYLAQRPVAFPVGLAGMEGAALTRSLGNPSGSLPFSVVFDRAGSGIARRLGQVSEADLAGFVKAVG